jgi:A/G-specific adenine glycosylase
MKKLPAVEVSGAVLAWYDQHRRDLPWRARPGMVADPYRVWLSEIMLQQTTVATVADYFNRFTTRWPRVSDLAAADLDQILGAWAGLGYYARARNLHACAKAVVARHNGQFPDGEADLLALPGIGPYTAAAIAAIAFGHQASPVDGNIERVTARLFAITTPLPKAKPAIKAAARSMTPKNRAGDFAQALMDLGSMICTPRRPNCDLCPQRALCLGRAQGIAETLPVKAPKRVRPTRYGLAFLGHRADGAILVRKRPPRGLLGGMLEVPSSEWGDEPVGFAPSLAPSPGKWKKIAGDVAHVFTHFTLRLTVYQADIDEPAPGDHHWLARADLATAALPTVMKKVLQHGGITFRRPRHRL